MMIHALIVGMVIIATGNLARYTFDRAERDFLRSLRNVQGVKPGEDVWLGSGEVAHMDFYRKGHNAGVIASWAGMLIVLASGIILIWEAI